MNITEADRINQRSVIEAFLDNETEISGLLHRAEAKPDDHAYDYWLQYYNTSTMEWMTYGLVEIKCRSKYYKTLKISQAKMKKLFEFSQKYGVPFFLIIWFRGESVIHILSVQHLKFPEATVVNEKLNQNAEPSFDIPISKFDRAAPIDAEFMESASMKELVI